MNHLDDAEIERYASRRGDADDILRIAAHLDACDECRDRAAAMVDSGIGEQSHTRRRQHSDRIAREARAAGNRTVAVVIFALLLVIALAAVVWLSVR